MNEYSRSHRLPHRLLWRCVLLLIIVIALWGLNPGVHQHPLAPVTDTRDLEQPTGSANIPQNPRMGLTFSNYFAGNPMYAKAREAGASYDRIEFQMSALNPSPGTWNWGNYDTLVANENAHGLQVLAVLTSPPLWAADSAYLQHYESWPVPANLNLPWNDPANYWAQFVYQLVAHYKASIKSWQVWNEPDIRKYWQMPEVPASLFAQLLRVSFQAIKAADPGATVVMGGFLYRHDQWPSPITMWQAIRDLPDSAANNNYFDVMAFHLYDGGTCEHFDVIEDFHQHMIQPPYGGLNDHPIWITESGIRQWEGQVPRNPGDRFATDDEAASYVIQNYTYALSKDIPRYYYFRTTDDSSTDVNRWGLIRMDTSLRPSYTAYQVAAQYLPISYTFSTRPGWYQNPANPVSRISFYGTSLGRVSVIWNVTNSAQAYALNAVLSSATLVLQNGVTSTLLASNGGYSFTLPATTNFSWHNPPNDCLVASPPLIIIEPDTTPPTSILNTPSVTSTQTAIMLTWSGADPSNSAGQSSGVWSYDLQYRINNGPWIVGATWIYGTSAIVQGVTDAHFDFRVRARDRAGNEQDWNTANIVSFPIDHRTRSLFLPIVVHETAPAPLCANPVTNGGFEQDGGWMINPTPNPATYTASIAYGGLRSLQTGIPPNMTGILPESFSSVSQTLQLPAPGVAISLTLWRNAQVQDVNDSTYVRIWDQNGALHTLTETTATQPGWQPLRFDLTPYAGQRISLLLGAHNNGNGPHAVAYYDDVAVECQPAQ